VVEFHASEKALCDQSPCVNPILRLCRKVVNKLGTFDATEITLKNGKPQSNGTCLYQALCAIMDTVAR